MSTSQPPENPTDPTPVTASAGPGSKDDLRASVTAARALMSGPEREVYARGLAGHLLAAPEVRDAESVAAYVAVGDEPGTSWVLDGLRRAGVRVLLPVLLDDDDLDWAAYDGPESLAAGRFGLREPSGPRLGVDAVGDVDVVLLPGLAASSRGLRLGRGGGSYDRALTRVPYGTFTCVLLYDGESDRDVPREPHDRAVEAVATPSGLTRLRPLPAG